ncbi:hypothetical protein PCE1_000012 [Barthelona sp. PCE]
MGRPNTVIWLLLLAFLTLCSCGTNWAVLLRTSKGWKTYRHEADVYHFYNTLVSKGFKKENIIVLSANDIASSSMNRQRGKVFHDSKCSKNYQEGIDVDYTGTSVTPIVFLEVLQGKTDIQKSLSSNGRSPNYTKGAGDRLFVFSSGHGHIGELQFQKHNQKLSAVTLKNTLLKLIKEKKIDSAFFIVESCHSGSMFSLKEFNGHSNIYAITASKGRENSYAAAWARRVFMFVADEFTYNTLSVLDEMSPADFDKVTIEELSKTVSEKVKMSHPMHFGDHTLGKKHLSYFLHPQSDS